MGRDTAPHHVSAFCKKETDRTVTVKGIFAGMEEVPALMDERRDPVGIAAVEVEREPDKVSDLSGRVGGESS
jgi:hypothetical protein